MCGWMFRGAVVLMGVEVERGGGVVGRCEGEREPAARVADKVAVEGVMVFVEELDAEEEEEELEGEERAIRDFSALGTLVWMPASSARR